MLRTSLLSAIALVLFAAAAFADVIVTRDGQRIEGVIVRETATEVVVRTRLGEITVARDRIVDIERGKTRRQEFDERWSAAKTADAFHELGLWADDAKMAREARRAMKRALELDTKHAGANTWFGNVQYKGEWMTPEERDQRMAADRDAEMAARGLVKHGDDWVTPQERENLEKGLVLHEGKWMPFAEVQRAKGLEDWNGAWISSREAVARRSAAAVAEAAGVKFQVALGGELVLVAGPLPEESLARVAERCVAGRAWFDERYALEPTLDLFAGRMAELYLFGQDAPYMASIPHLATLSHTLPPGWGDAVKTTHGFLFWDPFPLSSARRWKREELDLEGHCYHHFGHLLVNRLGYDGRLLPPWYDEALSALVEYALHGRNAVFCRSSTSEGRGTAAAGAMFSFDPRDLREGSWKGVLSRALEENAVLSFDHMARKQFSELELLDVAIGMGVLEWLSLQGPEALAKFHVEVRRVAPQAPTRVIDKTSDRQAHYDAAFLAACGMTWRDADQAWRAWARNR